MLLIAHRGNLKGPNPEEENTVGYLQSALDKGYDVEVDVWYVDGKLYLGHDEPGEEAPLGFLRQDGVWAHAKNVFSLDYLLDTGVHCFYHIDDPMTVTSRGFIWCFPAIYPTERSVAVMPEVFPTTNNLSEFFGVCTDLVEEYKGL